MTTHKETARIGTPEFKALSKKEQARAISEAMRALNPEVYGAAEKAVRRNMHFLRMQVNASKN